MPVVEPTRHQGAWAIERWAARTDTEVYPRSASGRALALDASSPAAFHAARSSPNANQLREASRLCIQNARGLLKMGVAGMVVMDMEVSSLVTRSFAANSDKGRMPNAATSGQIVANSGSCELARRRWVLTAGDRL